MTAYAARSTQGPLLGVAMAVVLAAGAGWWGYSAWSGDGRERDPDVAAATEQLQSFLDAWAAGQAAKAAPCPTPPENAESLLTSVMTNLKPTKAKLSAGDGKKNDKGNVTIPYTARFTVPAVGLFRYESEATLVKKAEKWTVEFGSPMIHPRLVPGRRSRSRRWPSVPPCSTPTATTCRPPRCAARWTNRAKARSGWRRVTTSS